jgi:uncharacterized protein (UPF0332 family)
VKKINWCLKTKNGIELIEPNENLSLAYLKKSEDSLRAFSDLDNNKDWEVSSLYYAQYFALYSILMKIGIKSEIHQCTIEFMKEFLFNHFTKEEMDLIINSQISRNDMQYYSDKNISELFFNKMKSHTPMFIVRCKFILNQIDDKFIQKTRKDLKYKINK